MSIIQAVKVSTFFVASLILTACQLRDFGEIKSNFSQLKEVPATMLSMGKNFNGLTNKYGDTDGAALDAPLQLNDIVGSSLVAKNQGTDFLTAVRYALDTDPEIASKRRMIDAKLASVAIAEARKDFEVGATVYGGIEDVTDNTKGLALAINTSRLVFDGGKLDSQIQSSMFELEAAQMDLAATIDARANDLFQKWLELEKYKSLQAQIEKRLLVLDPLITQLEKVAEAGIGDTSKVTAAQRTVSAIRVEKAGVEEGLAQARLDFSNAFGAVNSSLTFDYDFITNLVPSEINDSLVQNAPLLKAQYARYQASLGRVKAARAKDGLDVGFEARALRPFAGSEYGSDESLGLIGRKTLYKGGMLKSEIEEAEAISESSLSQIKAIYRAGARSLAAAVQNVESMEKAILVARENARLTSDEIVYLRQQLIIGGSTLDSVLSAEALLYEAESREIKYFTEKCKSQVVIVSSLGLLSGALGY